jgi:predicted phage terminase large subunit-like protein|tara:strand:- start:1688 stop:3148 length:1461 start_codon:yes stop_codon:yes gene_type:complete
MKLAHLSDQEIKETLVLQERLETLNKQEQCHNSFLFYVEQMWPEFICGRHHEIFAQKLEDVANGKINRLIVNMPPRHTKSEFCSTYFPAWIMGKQPNRKIMQTTHTGELAVRFGRKVRNMMDSVEYKRIFDNVELQADSKSAGRWETNKGGEYFAAGVGGAITGRGADLLIIDDPHSEQDALSPSALESCWEWYTSGPRQRLQPGGAIIVVMTRWSTIDLTAKLLEAQKEEAADQWEVVEFPAIFPDTNDSLWPEFWEITELEKVKASLPVQKWNAQWMQNPTSEEGSIIKREWWNMWEYDEMPAVSYIIQSYDTAFSKKENADYSAISTWGVFRPTPDSPDCLILLDAQKGRWDFPELKRIAFNEYKYWEPDMTLIEAKASGTPLTHELRRLGIPVVNYSPTRGHDKSTRMHSVAPIFESKLVYAPQRKFAEEMIEECAAFPFGKNDDLCDTMTQALMRFREGGLVSLEDDYSDEEKAPVRRVYY